MIRIPLFSIDLGDADARLGRWVRMDTKDVSGASVMTPTGWQKEAIEELKASRVRVVNAPTGSGKGFVLRALSAVDLHQDQDVRTVISFPQSVIGDGLREAQIRLEDVTLHWSCENLCRVYSPVSSLVDFLTRPRIPNDMARSVICTHACLVAAYKRVPKDAWDHVRVSLDEAHHAKNATYENDAEQLDSNKLGELLMLLLENELSGVTLATATPYRGDRLAIAPNLDSYGPAKFHLPYDEYLKGLRWLRKIHYNFYVGNPDEAVKEIFSKRSRTTLVYVPPENSRFTRGKSVEVAAYADAVGGFEDEGDPVRVLNTATGPLRTVNMVPVEGRERRRKEVAESLKTDPLDAIFFLGIGKEGFDYPPADRAIVVGMRKSYVENVQILGRLLRDFPNKASVEVDLVWPSTVKEKDEDSFKRFLNLVLSALMLEDVMDPIPIPGRNAFAKQFPDESQRLEILELVTTYALSVQGELSEEALREAAIQVLKDFGPVDPEVVEFIVRLLKRSDRGPSEKEHDLSSILLAYSSTIGADTLSALRSRVAKAIKPFTYIECKQYVQSRMYSGFERDIRYYRYRVKDGTFDPRCPKFPERQYANEWDKEDFFGSMGFLSCRMACVALGIASLSAYKDAYDEKLLPVGAPVDPSTRYADRDCKDRNGHPLPFWQSEDHFFGIAKMNFQEFLEHLKSVKDILWNKGFKPRQEARPRDIHWTDVTWAKKYQEMMAEGVLDPCCPLNPKEAYEREWDGWWKIFWLPMHSYSSWVFYTRQLKITKEEEYRKYVHWTEWVVSGGHSRRIRQWDAMMNPPKPFSNWHLDKKMPFYPEKFYRGRGWTGWEVLSYFSYDEWKTYIIKKRNFIDGPKEYEDLLKKGILDKRVPERPEKFYRGTGWQSWEEALR